MRPMQLIGVVHLPALPGSPRSALSLAGCIDAGVRDAQSLAEGGADGIIVENFHDVPFRGDVVEPHTVAAMTAAAIAIRAEVDCPLGINVRGAWHRTGGRRGLHSRQRAYRRDVDRPGRHHGPG
jgi:predicted TIM-barrel enzyme